MAKETTKKKTSPVVWVLIAGACVAAYVLTEPDTTPAKKKSTTRLGSSKTAGADGFTPEDLTAKFPRYSGPARDAFQPKVVAKVAAKAPVKTTPLTLPPPRPVTVTLPAMSLDAWTLTGINVVNGSRSALLENKTSGESVFLKAGANWNTFKVGAVEPGALVLIGPTGTVKRIGFPEAPPEKVAGAAPADVPAPNVNLPNLTPGAPSATPEPTRRRRNRVRTGDTVAQNADASQNGVQP